MCALPQACAFTLRGVAGVLDEAVASLTRSSASTAAAAAAAASEPQLHVAVAGALASCAALARRGRALLAAGASGGDGVDPPPAELAAWDRDVGRALGVAQAARAARTAKAWAALA